MKKFLIGAAALLALGTAANAADLGSRMVTKAPPMIAMDEWSGFYVGLNGGGASGRKCWDVVSGALFVSEGCHDIRGGLFGGQLGYRMQTGPWVFGLEAQGDWANLKGSRISAAVPGGVVTDTSRLDGLALFTGQIGWAFSPSWLLYVKGGAALTWDRYEHLVTGGALINSADETRLGAVVGAGIEYGLTRNWSVAFEYDHLFMGTRDIDFRSAASTITDRERIRQDVDLFTARLNYRFGGGPVMARY
jgi:outer membrane immunogenic protein